MATLKLFKGPKIPQTVFDFKIDYHYIKNYLDYSENCNSKEEECYACLELERPILCN